jgi:hypothetical protein
MATMFNTLLRDAGLNPAEVRLYHHADKSAKKGRSPFELWRDNRSEFERYQSGQNFLKRKTLSTAPYWAVFIKDLNNKTMFAGIYRAKYRGLLDRDMRWPHNDEIVEAGTCDIYELALDDKLREFIGRLFIDWGGAQQAAQYAHTRNKRITEFPEARTRKRRRATAKTLLEEITNVIEDPKIGATEKAAQILARIGQDEFRKRVLGRWRNCCAVTGSKTLEAIRASHIKPWSDCDPTNGERLIADNGIPLIASLDALFDKGLISFDSSGRMIVSAKLDDSERQIFGIDEDKSLTKKPTEKMAAYLAYHREKRFRK